MQDSRRSPIRRARWASSTRSAPGRSGKSPRSCWSSAIPGPVAGFPCMAACENRSSKSVRGSSVRPQPAIEETVDPAIERRIVERVHGQMHAALLGTRHLDALGSLERPDFLHLQRDLGMKLEPERIATVTEGLHGVAIVGGQQLAACRHLHAFAMPLVDLHRRPDPIAAGLGGLDIDITDLDQPIRMGRHAAADGARQELGTEAKTEERNAGLDHLGNPFQFALDAGQGAAIVGRHRSAENHHASVFGHVFGQIAAEIRAKAVKLVSALLEEDPDPSGSGVLLVHDDCYFLGTNLFRLQSRYRHGFAKYASLVASTRRTYGGETKWRASSTSISIAPARGPISPFTPCGRSQQNSARKLRGSPSWSVACSMPSTRWSTT